MKEGKGRERGRGGQAEEKHWRTKQPDSPAVCKLIAHPPVTWQKREGDGKEKGRKKNNLNFSSILPLYILFLSLFCKVFSFLLCYKLKIFKLFLKI